MRYAICFTPSPSEPLSYAAATWLGRDVYSGQPCDPPSGIELSIQDLAYYTAIPRRYGFHAMLKSPFLLRPEITEAKLLRELMCFASKVEPFDLPRFECGRLGDHFGLFLSQTSSVLDHLAASITQHFCEWTLRDEAMVESTSSEHLSASQLTNFHRWGDPFVMDEYRFQMPLTGRVDKGLVACVERAVKHYFTPLLEAPLTFANLALFIEEELGAPLRVHSLHPLGAIKSHRKRAHSISIH